MPSKKAKLAMMARPAAAPPPGAGMSAADNVQLHGLQNSLGGNRQGEVWASVAETQAKLSANLGAPVAAPLSASSLQLSLENEKLNATKAAYVKALTREEKDGADVVGFAFAINGRINSADIYPSHGLLAKMWGKLIDAAATEAIGEMAPGGTKPAPETAAVMAFLADAAKAAPEERKLDANSTRVTRQNSAVVQSETRQKDGGVVHRSVVAF